MSEINQNKKKEGFGPSNKKDGQRSGLLDKNFHHKDDKPIEINKTGVAPIIDSRLESEAQKDSTQKSRTLDDRIEEMNTTAVEVKTEHTVFTTNSPAREKENEKKQKINIDDVTNTAISEVEKTSPKTIVMFIVGIVIGALITSIIL